MWIKVIEGILIPFLGTALGAACVFFLRGEMGERTKKALGGFASGIMVAESLKAADMLAAEGISARVIDMFTWKPIDAELLEESARKTGAVVTAENHNYLSGLGAPVAEVVAQGNEAAAPVPADGIGSAVVEGEDGLGAGALGGQQAGEEVLAGKAGHGRSAP